MAGRVKPALALAVAILLAGLIAACGGGGGETTAADATGAAPSERADTTATDAGQGSGGSGQGASGKRDGGGANDGSGSGGAAADGGGDPGSGSGGSSGSGTAGSGSGDSGGSGGSSGGGGGGGSGSGGGSSSGDSGDFIVPGGDNSVQEFGDEASAAERAQASQELQGYMTARAAEDQQGACAALSATAKSQLGDLAQAVQGAAKGDSCVAIFKVIDKQTPPAARANTMTGPIASLRVEGERGFALYHGTKDTDYTINMEREGGAWKVGALVPYPLS